MSTLFIHHVIGDLTVGKPDLTELYDSDTLEVAARVIAASPEASAAVLRRPPENGILAREEKLVGLINPLEIVGFLARNCPDGDHMQREALMKAATVREAIDSDQLSLKEIDPGTRYCHVSDLDFLYKFNQVLLLLGSFLVLSPFVRLINRRSLERFDLKILLLSFSESIVTEGEACGHGRFGL